MSEEAKALSESSDRSNALGESAADADLSLKREAQKLERSKLALEVWKFRQARAELLQRSSRETQNADRDAQEKKRRQLWEEEDRVDARKKDLWGRLISISPIIVALIAPTFAYVSTKGAEERTRASQQKSDAAKLEADQLAARLPFIQRRVAAYENTLNVVETIISEDKNSAAFQSAVAEFEKLYWTKMVLVEDRDVESAMVAFRNELMSYKEGKSTKSNGVSLTDLKSSALELTKKIGPSLSASYNSIQPGDKTLDKK